MQTAANAEQLTDLGSIGLVLATSSLALAPITLVIARRLFPGRNVVFRRWGFSHLLAVILAIGAGLALGAALFPLPQEGNALVPAFARMTLGLGAGGILAAFFARKYEPEGLRALGFPLERNLQALVAGWTSYAMLLPGLVGVMLVWSWILAHTDPTVGLQPALQHALELPRGERWPAVLLGVFVLPFFEELLFRGFLQPLLVQNLHERAGVALTALCFALLHGTAAFLPIFAFALLLGGLMLRTQRLVATWGVHALHNALVFATVFWFPDAVHKLQGAGLLWSF
ncbi:MAG: CPBP family intramembrane metalloprotease [Planctomycetes bacterium]|nr:CPBP family intramembrane metalloprotease [Planctomycetota bacterium]